MTVNSVASCIASSVSPSEFQHLSINGQDLHFSFFARPVNRGSDSTLFVVSASKKRSRFLIISSFNSCLRGSSSDNCPVQDSIPGALPLKGLI